MLVCDMFTHMCVRFLFSENTKLTHLSIYLGKSAINETNASSEQKFAVERLIMHEGYNDITYNNDIGEHKLCCD